MSKYDILVLDSGLGGLSISNEITRLLPNYKQVYFADHQYVPYGDKSSDWLINRLSLLLSKLIPQYDPSIVVVACNTASTVVLPSLRKQFQVEIVGVVPAVKTAASKRSSSHIGILSTEATSSSEYLNNLIKQFAAKSNVKSIGSNRLVNLAESKLRGQKICIDELKEICSPFIFNNECSVDTLVLGCTHFPLLKEELQTVLGSKVSMIDSGQAIARRVQQLLPLAKGGAGSQCHTFLSSCPKHLPWLSESGLMRRYRFDEVVRTSHL